MIQFHYLIIMNQSPKGTNIEKNIPFINHEVDIVVERSPANPGIFLCVLLG